MKLTEEQLARLWLSSAELSAHQYACLTSEHGSAAEIRERFDQLQGAFTPRMRSLLASKRSEEFLTKTAEELEEKKVHLLFLGDEQYPEWLSHIDDPPYLLYYAGHLSAFSQPMIGIVGTRRASSYGREMAENIAYDLCKAGVTVVSGLAYGVDAAAHRGALKAKGVTIGVMGSGINRPYPAEHQTLMREMANERGLVISEYPLNATPSKYHFPYRNRIISGLSLGIVYVEGSIKGGGMHTVNAALDQGREVFAVPGQVGTFGAEGPNAILREGARLITSAEDLLLDLDLIKPMPVRMEKPEIVPVLNELQGRIMELLRTEVMNSQQLSQRLKVNENDVITELGIMEISGTILRETGNQFRLPLKYKRR